MFRRWCGLALAAAAALTLGVRGGAAPPPVPPHVAELTVLGLRPRNLSASLADKNTADDAGDLFFFVTDRLVTPYACRHSRNASWLCHQRHLLYRDQVYTRTRLQVDATFGGCPSGDPACSAYADCNPDTRDASGRTWICTCADEVRPRISAACLQAVERACPSLAPGGGQDPFSTRARLNGAVLPDTVDTAAGGSAAFLGALPPPETGDFSQGLVVPPLAVSFACG